MILIDSNALIVLLIGMVDVRLFKTHRRVSIYEEQDYIELLSVIGSLDKLVVLPNVWTEVDNLLNNFTGHYKSTYINKFSSVVKFTTEKFLSTITATDSYSFFDLGVTDSLLLEYGKECQLLITSDSSLSDYANARGIKVYDLKKNRNLRF